MGSEMCIRDSYIAGSELRANMNLMDTTLCLGMKDNSESALSTKKEAISNATMNLMESSILAQDRTLSDRKWLKLRPT